MRTKSTNILQIVILISGVCYLVIGITFYLSPLAMLQFFAENVSDNWLDMVRSDELVAPLYQFCRGFAALVFSSGAAMILPLFDPLRYRGLIYFNGLIFPFFASILLLKNGLAIVFFSNQPGDETSNSVMDLARSHGGHLIVLIVGIIFLILFVATLIGILITRTQAKQGIE